MKNARNLIVALTSTVVCLLCIFCLSVSTFAVDSAQTVPAEAESELTEAESEPADKEEKSIFVINESEKVKYTVNSTEYELYKAEVSIDIDNNEKTNASDAREILRISAKLAIYNGAINEIDMSQDGNVDAGDARMLLRYSAKLDSYYVTESGQTITGFAINESGKTYYFDCGALVSGLKNIDGSIYYFDANGMVTGFAKNGSAIYYFGSDGKAVNGAQTIDGKQYYFENYKARVGLYQEGDYYTYYDENGVMATSNVTVDGVLYIIGSDGKGQPYVDPSTYKIAMLGDSHVANLSLSDVTDRIDFYGKVSLHASDVFAKKVSGSSKAVIDEIKGMGYDKIIILVGVNDLSYANSIWIDQYRAVVQGVKQRAPQADIYAHAVLPINEAVAKKNGYSVTNEMVKSKNSIIQQVAQEEGIYYIDPSPVLVDSSGLLPANAATDGIHLTKNYCGIWSEWLIDAVCKIEI